MERGRTPTAPRARVRWVEAFGELAIIIQEGDSGLLIRYATRHHSNYHWISKSDARRRRDMDDRWPEPNWLKQARESTRPSRILWPLIHDDQEPEPREHMFDTDAAGRPKDDQ